MRSFIASCSRRSRDFERLKDFNENIVESINIGVFAVDLEDRIESWNAQMEVMYALPRVDALRRPLSDVFPADFLEQFDRLRAEQGVSTIYKFRFNTPAGEARTANITIAPLLNRDFHAVGRIVIVDDLTDRIHPEEEQLTQSEKLSSIGLLAAGVAHEVNTPLAVISSYTQMLTKQLRADPENQRLTPVLEKITQQAFRASEIVNGLAELLTHRQRRVSARGHQPNAARYGGAAAASTAIRTCRGAAGSGGETCRRFMAT